ncbi:MAG: 50S ribosomal protein L15 [Candidatus Omnitrophota bacterium]
MQIHEFKSPKGSRKRKRIVGRGNGSGSGKTSGRGMNGQNCRPGSAVLIGSEGGQMPIIRRLPKVGFNSHRPILYQIIKLSDLSKFKKGDVVDAKVLKDAGLIHNVYKPFKILGEGELEVALTVKATAFSKSAVEKIEKAGGKTEIFDKSAFKNETAEK